MTEENFGEQVKNDTRSNLLHNILEENQFFLVMDDEYNEYWSNYHSIIVTSLEIFIKVALCNF